MKAFLTVVFVILAIVGIVGCANMIDAGNTMEGIRSQAGNTVAELYYQGMGKAFAGLGQFLIVAILGSTITILYFMWIYNSQAKKENIIPHTPTQPEAPKQTL